MAAQGLHISISAEPIATLGGFELTNSIFTSLIVSAILILFAIVANSQLKQTDKPKGMQNFAEWLVETFHNFIYSVTGNFKKTRLFLPLVTSFFLWIALNNWLGLVPGVGTISVVHEETEEIAAATSTTGAVYAQEELGQTETALLLDEEPHLVKVPIFRPGTADLNTTIALALFSVIATQIFGVQAQKLGYFKKFINFKNPIMFFVGILELISEFAKVISFAFRLFGNIFAGEVLLVVIAFLIPVIIPMPFYGLELFVGFIQALVFAMLSLVFFNMATQSHDDH